MKVQARQIKNHLIIEVDGDILMENSRDFSAACEEAITASQYENIFINFSKVTFMDSSGIGALIRVSSMIKSLNKKLVVHSLNKNLNSVLKLSGLHNMLSIYTIEQFKQEFPEIDNV